MTRFEWQRETIVPAGKARAWWFDLQESDHMGHHHKPLYRGRGASRKILSRSATEVVAEDDYGQGPPVKATLRLVGDDRISTVMESRMYRSDGTVTFTPKGSGSALRLAFESEWRGFAKLFGLLYGRRFLDLVRKDLEAHVVEMEEDWKRKPW